MLGLKVSTARLPVILCFKYLTQVLQKFGLQAHLAEMPCLWISSKAIFLSQNSDMESRD